MMAGEAAFGGVGLPVLLQATQTQHAQLGFGGQARRLGNGGVHGKADPQQQQQAGGMEGSDRL
ncbi:hypothetical protein MBH78_07955 [Oceanimonas sp. NS1]|nr:hypothetical protein [Oceanimonas sp. NS1]